MLDELYGAINRNGNRVLSFMDNYVNSDNINPLLPNYNFHNIAIVEPSIFISGYTVLYDNAGGGYKVMDSHGKIALHWT